MCFISSDTGKAETGIVVIASAHKYFPVFILLLHLSASKHNPEPKEQM